MSVCYFGCNPFCNASHITARMPKICMKIHILIGTAANQRLNFFSTTFRFGIQWHDRNNCMHIWIRTQPPFYSFRLLACAICCHYFGIRFTFFVNWLNQQEFIMIYSPFTRVNLSLQEICMEVIIMYEKRDIISAFDVVNIIINCANNKGIVKYFELINYA